MEAKFIKPAGTTYLVRDGQISNTYNYTLLNKGTTKKTVTIKVLEPAHGEIRGGSNIVVEKDKMAKGSVAISFPEKEINKAKQNIKIGIYDEKGELIDEYETYFEGPFKLQF